MFKKLFSFMFIALCSILLVSCKGDETVELKTKSMFGGTDPHVEAYQSLIAEFEKENEVKVKDNSATSDEVWKTSVLSDFYSGIEPDVLFYFTGATAKPLVTNDYVVSVADIRKEYPEFAKNVADSVMDPYAVPIKGFVEGVFVNTALFTGDLAPYLTKEVWTWADYLDIAVKMNAKNIIPFAFGATDVPHYWIEHTVLGSIGPNAFADVKKSITDNETKWVTGLKLINKLAELDWFGPTKGQQDNTTANQLFLEGKAAMLLDGSWFAGQITNTTVIKPASTIMMPFPAIPTAEGGKNEVYMQSGFTSGFYISKSAWNNPQKRELCVKFIEKMTSKDAITKFVESGGIPADSTVQLSNQTKLQLSMNTMPARTVSATLPLSDACKAQTFSELVNAANHIITGNEAGIKAALQSFSGKQ
jgi:raffinose/stachyose/melibiose transport system substrate-binding protein